MNNIKQFLIWGYRQKCNYQQWFPLFACTPLRGGTAAIGQPIGSTRFPQQIARFSVFFGVLLCCASCGTPYEPPTTALDCGRQFIEALYDGNFKRARQLNFSNAANQLALEQRYALPHQQMTSAQRDNLRNASININGVRASAADTSKSAIIIYFTNAYTSAPDSVLVRQANGEFKTDLTPTAP